MTSSNATLVLWMKSWGDSDAEMLVSGAHDANTLDLIERSQDVSEIGRVIVVGDSPRLTKLLRGLPVTLETDPHLTSPPFGQRLRSIIQKYAVGNLLYLGGGSGVFMDVEDMARLAQAALAFPETLWVNNFYSTDFAAFRTASLLDELARCRRDNHLGWILGRDTGMKARVLPPSLTSRFDIDTPVDLMVLKAHQKTPGHHLAEFLAQLTFDLSPLFKVTDALVHRESRILIIGRVPLQIAAFFDKATACHVNFHIEGRGMDAREEAETIHPWSLVGKSLETMGLREFFHALSREAQAMIMDSRVCFRHLGIDATRRDRFFSDLLRPDQVQEPFVRRFTRHARQSPVPCILGGHTLVSGGLYALAELAWSRTKNSLRPGMEDIPHDSWKGTYGGGMG
ncbi:MAG: hypothetical protein GTN74_12660 [Proteobacteria bacterium]|nr:hypothetical protein [Pseudomonadota bacterium]NIS71177.1 hypothetical protein [Pseudomonadota bacterium]